MEISIENPALVDLFEGRLGKKRLRSTAQLAKEFRKTLFTLKALDRIENIDQLPSLRYERLTGAYAGYSAVRVNGQNRLIFKENSKSLTLHRLQALPIEEPATIPMGERLRQFVIHSQ